jgi:hypothetical protein
VNGEVADVLVHTFDAGQPRFAVRQRFRAFWIGRVPEVIRERDERFDGGRGARGDDVLSIIEDRAVGRHEAGLEPFGRAAEGNQAVGNLFGERAGLWALACHVDWHVDRTVGQPAVGREDLGETAVDVGNVAAQQCLNVRDMRAHAREAQGLLAHPRTAVMINSNQGWSLRDEIKEAIGREYDWPDLDKEVTVQQLPASIEGTYRTDKGLACDVTCNGSELKLRIGKQAPISFARASSGFVSSVVNASVQFTPSAEAATVLVLTQMERTFRFEKTAGNGG